MKKRKLNYRFHNPNTAEVTADYLLKILIEANASKVEQAIQEAANELPEQMNGTEGHSTQECRVSFELCVERGLKVS